MRTCQKLPHPSSVRYSDLHPCNTPVFAPEFMPMAHALARAQGFVQGTLGSKKREGIARRELRKRGQSKISLSRCTRRTGGLPEF